MMKIALVDDHPVTLYGLKWMLTENQGNDIQLIKSYTKGNDLLKDIESIDIDVLLIDLKLPDVDGFDLVKIVKGIRPDLRVGIYTSFYSKQTLLQSVKSKTNGIISKTVKPKNFVKCIQQMVHSEEFVISGEPIPELNPDTAPGSRRFNKISLTNREKELLNLILEGTTNKEIASILQISLSTVEFHRKNLYKKFNVDNVASFIKKAQQVETSEYEPFNLLGMKDNM